ncbi:hypothetical protein DOJK_02449 [Patescibacteria group bacterium]|nr:hypothetical protein DOJK_02449 [Patescibacteria group bacterium]
MRLSYHVLIDSEYLNQIQDWQTACQEFGIHTDLSSLNEKHSVLKLNYQNLVIELTVYTSPASDVTDICDDLKQYLDNTQNLAINFDINGEQKSIYIASIAISILTGLMNGILYIEGDGVIITAEQALLNAKEIANAL